MSKFIQIDYYNKGLIFYNGPSLINIDHISKIEKYRPGIYTMPKDKNTSEDGAIGTVFVTLNNSVLHLDVESSDKLLYFVNHHMVSE